MTEIAFVVRGRPVPQGSAKAFVVKGARPRAVIVTGAGKGPLADWRGLIAAEARLAVGDVDPLEGPVSVAARFIIARPAAHYHPANGRRAVRELRLDAPRYPIGVVGDVDKLARAVLDALTSVLIRDDSQVASLMATKLYETPDMPEGVRIRLTTLEATQ